MVAVLILFGVLGGIGVLLTFTLMRRGGSRTETVEGLLMEEQALRQARKDRVSFGTDAVMNSQLTASDTYTRREGRR
ncbi:hypothetical protein ACWFR1_08160 [Streptomyces sp. NPDC055103]